MRPKSIPVTRDHLLNSLPGIRLAMTTPVNVISTNLYSNFAVFSRCCLFIELSIFYHKNKIEQ